MTDITSKLERIALVAEVANHYIDDMRVMPAAGVADTIREAMAQLESTMRDDRAYILEERDRTFALMLARVEKAEAERDQARGWHGKAKSLTERLTDTITRAEKAEAERDQWIKHAKNAVWSDSEELTLAEAERDRLRAALEDALAGQPQDDSCEAWATHARAALNPAQEPKP